PRYPVSFPTRRSSDLTLYVSAAAGAIGSMVGQIGKILGCRVIGSAGTNEKVTRLIALGFDDAFNYRVTDPEDALKKLAPNGVDRSEEHTSELQSRFDL